MRCPTGINLLSVAALLWIAGQAVTDEKPLKELRHFSGHKSDVNCLAFSRDGRYLATGSGSDSSRSSDNSVRVWEVETAKEVCKLEGHTGAVFSVAFSPDGKQIASGSTDKTIGLWDLERKKEIRRFDGHTSAVVSLAFSPDGKRILSSGYDRTVRVWEAQTGKELQSFDFSQRGYSYYIGPVLFSESGDTALYYPNGTAEISKQVVVFDMKKGDILHTMQGHRDVVRCIAFTPDGRFALSTGYDIAFKLWDAKKGVEIRSFSAPRKKAIGVAITPDGKKAISDHEDGMVYLWDLEKGEEIASTKITVQYIGARGATAISPDGRLAVTANHRDAVLWNINRKD